VVDDEQLVRDTMSRLLQHLGYRVFEAKNGADALGLLNSSPEKPSLMILDLMMPGISAIETFRAARELVPELPVLFCSGFAPEALVSSVKSAPRTARLDKPFSSHDLQAAVRSLLQGTV
jgi:CheY-like chemotaxis protein